MLADGNLSEIIDQLAYNHFKSFQLILLLKRQLYCKQADGSYELHMSFQRLKAQPNQ